MSDLTPEQSAKMNAARTLFDGLLDMYERALREDRLGEWTEAAIAVISFIGNHEKGQAKDSVSREA